MPTKAEQYAQMAEKVAVQLTGSWQEWAGFLTTAARLYKYPFHEQLMIYAQRPDATACAEYDLWNNRMGRYVRRGSKGIALVDDSGDRLRLRYVFDISDTGTREHSRTPWLWRLGERHMEPVAAHPHPEDGFAGMEVRGDTLTDKENAGAALLVACKEVKNSDPVPVGSYRGFAMSVSFDAWRQEYTLLLKGKMTHRASLGTDPRGNLTRIDNALSQMPQRLEAAKAQLENLYQQQAAAKEEVGKPFPYEEELREKSARLVELDTLLNLDGRSRPQPETVVAKSARPSVLDSLKRPSPPRNSEKKPKQHEQEVR